MTSPRPAPFVLPALLAALALAGCGGAQQATPSPLPSQSTSRVGGEEQRSVPSDSASPQGTASPPASAQGSASPSASGAATSSAEATPNPGGGALPTPSGSARPYQGAKLPQRFGDYTGTLNQHGTTQLGMYTGASQDKMLMVSMVKGDTAKVAAGLTGATVVDHAVCGKQVGVETCLLLLDGGYVHVQGTDQDTQASLAAVTNQLWAALG